MADFSHVLQIMILTYLEDYIYILLFYRARTMKQRSAVLQSNKEQFEINIYPAFKHIDQGLQFLNSLDAKNKAREAALEKEREQQERDNIKMYVPNQAIPMGYNSSSANTNMVHD